MAKSEDIKDIIYYMSLPYTTILRPDEEGDFVARIEELPGCVAHGANHTEALESLREAQQLWIEDCLESGQPVPEPHLEEALPSGKWVQRVPRSLHKKLGELAKKEAVSLNQLVTSMLSDAVAERTLKDHFRGWFEEFAPALKVSHSHVGPWESTFACESPGTWLLEEKASNLGLLTQLTTARKLICTHIDESTDAYDAKTITGYKEAAESARRRR